jgi:hypothetical protein
VWCDLSTDRIFEPVFFEDTDTLPILLWWLTWEECSYALFQQDSAIVAWTIAESCLNKALTIADMLCFNKTLLLFMQRSNLLMYWSASSHHTLPTSDSVTYLWGTIKQRIYWSSPHAVKEVKDKFWRESYFPRGTALCGCRIFMKVLGMHAEQFIHSFIHSFISYSSWSKYRHPTP